MGIASWIGVGCVCWCVVSCGLGLVAAKLLAVQDRSAEVDAPVRSGVTR
jgi:hypothetical protein